MSIDAEQQHRTSPAAGFARVGCRLLFGPLLAGIGLFWCFSLLLTPTVRAAGGITVTTTTDEFGGGAGCSLREAIQTANTNADFGGCIRAGAAPSPPYTIYVPSGTYSMTLTGFPEDLNASGDFDITTSMTIQGVSADNTIINGQTGINPDRIFHIVYDASNVIVTISDMTVQNSLRTGGDSGGGITNSGNHATLNLLNLTVSNNAGDKGGGVSNFNGTVNLTNVWVITNTATDGGGIYNFSGVISATNCTIMNNRAGESGGNDGGGIYNAGTIHIRNSTIAGNSATAYGGGIYNSGQLNGIDTTIVDNRATDGGGLSIYFGSGNIANSTISDNYADRHGGGVYHMTSWSTFNLTHVTINNNTAEGSSGLGDGGGIHHSSGTITSKSSIIAGNTDRGGQTPDISGVLNSSGYNLIGSVGSTNFAGNTTGDQYGDPNGTTTPNAGAAEQPTPIDPRLGLLTGSPAYHPLLVGSPAIGQIEPANCTYLSSGGNPFFADGAPVTSDQAGTPRPQGATCDIGAHEIVRADLTISKRASTDSITTGGQLTYTLAVTNLGPQPARDVTLTDPLPNGVTFVSATSNLAVCGQIGGIVTCTLPLLNVVPISPSLQVTVTIMAPPVAGVITNTAAVTSTTPDQTTPNVATATTTIIPITTPRPPTLIYPIGIISDMTYIWEEEPAATWYRLRVNDEVQFSAWYRAEDICAEGTCAVLSVISLADGPHTWCVSAWNEAGQAESCEDFCLNYCIPPLPDPASLIAPQGVISDTTPTYTWFEVETSTWYRLWVDGPSGNVINQWYQTEESNCLAGVCAVTPTTVLSDGAHTWSIQTWNSAGYGPWSTPLDFYVGELPLPGPATLVAPSGIISDTTPTYTWHEVEHASWYRLWVEGDLGVVINAWYRAPDICAEGTCGVEPVLPLDEGYYIGWVQTWNSAGYGPWSTPLDFYVGELALPGPATLVAPSGIISDTTPTYTWDEVEHVSWYRLWVEGDLSVVINAWYLANDICAAGTCGVEPVLPLDEGYYMGWVQTWNSAGYGPWSQPLGFYVGQPSPLDPATLIAPAGIISDTTPTYTWQVVGKATWYRLLVDGSSGTVVSQWYKASNECHRDSGLCEATPGTILQAGDYSWWVESWDPYGSTWSDGLDFTVSTGAAGASATPSTPGVSGDTYRLYLPLVMKPGETAEAPTPLPTPPISEPPPGADLEDSPPAEQLGPSAAPPDAEAGSRPPLEELGPVSGPPAAADEAGGPPVDRR